MGSSFFLSNLKFRLWFGPFYFSPDFIKFQESTLAFFLWYDFLYQFLLVSSHFNTFIEKTNFSIASCCRLVDKCNFLLLLIIGSDSVCVERFRNYVFFGFGLLLDLIKDVFELADRFLYFADVLSGVGGRWQRDGKCIGGFFLFGSEDKFLRVLRVKFGFAFLGTEESLALEVIVGETAFGGRLGEGRQFLLVVGMNLHKNSC